MLYYCFTCKKPIKEDEIENYNQYSEAWGHIVYERFSCCPFCGDAIQDINDIACLHCERKRDCLKEYIENESFGCELGGEYIEYWEELKDE